MPLEPQTSDTYTTERIYALARRAGFSPEGAVKAAMVGMAESSGRYWITSPNPDGGTNVGLMQLDTPGGLGAGYSVEQLQDPLTNMRVAQKTSKDGTDWSKWQTWPADAKKFEKQARAAAAKDSGDSSWLDQAISGLTGGFGNTGNTVGGGGGDQGGLGSFLSLPGQITDFFTALAKPVEALAWFLNPTNWARILAGGVGVVLLIAGLVTLGLAV